MKQLHLITRKQALQFGLKFYYTGIACQNNHFSERQTSNGNCRKCCKTYMKQYHSEHKAESIARSNAWIKKTKYHRVLYKNNPEKFMASRRMRKLAKIHRTPKWLTKEHKKQMQTEYSLALWCSKVMGIKYHVDHIVPLQGKQVSGLHVPWNLQVIPAVDNLVKSNQFKV